MAGGVGKQRGIKSKPEQVYSFVDRGQHRVVLRSEMTPTVARMIARPFFMKFNGCLRYSFPIIVEEFWPMPLLNFCATVRTTKRIGIVSASSVFT